MKQAGSQASTMLRFKKEAYHFFRNWLPVFLYCLVIFIQSSHPTPKQVPHLPHTDKLLHLVAYALLGMLFLRGFGNSKFKTNYWFIRVASILLTGIYGATDEWHQYYVPYRSASIWDIIFDFLGGLFGVYIYEVLLERFPKIGRI